MGRTHGRTTSAGSSEKTLEQSAAAALAATGPTPSKGGLFSMAMGVWKKATSKLFDLEAKIANQVSQPHTCLSVVPAASVLLDGNNNFKLGAYGASVNMPN